jgi:hypothetical protein
VVAVAKPIMSDDTRLVLAQRQAAFTSLAKHPSWSEFEQEVGRKVTRLEKVILARVLSSNVEFTQREIDYMRGFVNGMKWLIAVPNGAEARLETYLQQQERKARQNRSEE